MATMDEKLDLILNKFEKVENTLAAIESKFSRENEELRQTVEHQKNHIIKLEDRLRKKNIVIHGLKSTEDQESEVIDLFKNKLKVDITPEEIDECYKLGKGDNKPTLVAFTSMKKKMLIMKAKYKLRESPENRIFINNDMHPETRARLAKLRSKERKKRPLTSPDTNLKLKEQKINKCVKEQPGANKVDENKVLGSGKLTDFGIVRSNSLSKNAKNTQ